MGWSIKQAHVFVINYASKLSSKVGSKYGVAASSFLPAANYMPAERRIRRLQRKGQERTTHGRRTGKQAEERKGLSSVRPRPSCLAHGGVGDVDGLAGAELPIPIDTMPQSEGERVETAKVCMGVPPSYSSLRA